MIQIKNKQDCSGCHACYNACKTNCITMEYDSEGFLYPVVNNEQCVNCRACEKVCPFTKNKPKRNTVPDTFAVKANDNSIKLKSSSGGLFSVFSNFILSNNGFVYGVAMSQDNKVATFMRIDSNKDLKKIQGSKYIQACVGDIFKNVKEDLQHKKTVLFSGVPCQINGLKQYLGKDYSNLYCIEVVCHGTPSPLLWKKYVEQLESKYKRNIKNVDFRYKKNGWKDYSFFVDFEDKKYIKHHLFDPYCRLFLNNISLRPSCYNCIAKQTESMADITLGDFWGLENYDCDLYDKNGVSLMMLQTPKGKVLFEEIKESVKYDRTDFESSIKENPCYYKSVSIPNVRYEFFEDLKNYSFDKLTKKYCRNLWLSELKHNIKKLI